MSDDTSPVESDSIPNYVQSVWDKLEELNCPIISSLEPWNGVEALLKPGDIRVKFLQWVLSSLDEGLADCSETTEILRTVSKLKLCAPDDNALITGRVPKPQQLSFLNLLINLLLARKRVDEDNIHDGNVSDTSSMSSDATFVTSTTSSAVLTRNFCRHSQFIDHLAAHRLIQVFQERVLRIPRDIELEFEQQGITQPGNKKLSVMSQVELLKSKLNSLEWDYFHQEEFLVKRNECSWMAFDEPLVTASLDKLTTAVEDILLMEDEFVSVYTDFFALACRKKSHQSKTNSLGEDMSKLFDLVQEVMKFFLAAKALRKSYDSFQTSLKDSTTDITDENLRVQKLTNIEEWLRVVRESVSNVNAKCLAYNVARGVMKEYFIY